ncbi:MAG TPA: FG-GAP-like repeat-containing protein [Candidatus Nanoarchaeia archaeon]|nr:FG-GAP-like repeat-containing protein [Candidatus Nanoarchaeia archaeon]
MKYRNIVAYSSIIAGLLGCQPHKEENTEIKPHWYSDKEAFARLNKAHDSGMALTVGDFDGDGDLDLIVGTGAGGAGDLYLFLNDGKGNFTLKEPAKK